MLRKTMLDECKGERFFEVLAAFSNAVLKKVLACHHSSPDRAPVARILATATSLPNCARESLLPLAIAHKAALVNIVKKKDEQRQRFANFQALLDTKAATIDGIIQQRKATAKSMHHTIPEKDAGRVKKQLEENWVGDQKWLEGILYGQGAHAEDAFLSMEFNDVWPLVERGYSLEDAAPQSGLLELLDSKVRVQQSRLEKWRVFYQKHCQESSVKESHGPPPPKKDIDFHNHLQLQIQEGPSSGKSTLGTYPLRTEYKDILRMMDEELSEASQRRYSRIGGPNLPKKTTSFNTHHAHVQSLEPTGNPLKVAPRLAPANLQVPAQQRKTTPSEPHTRPLHEVISDFPLHYNTTLAPKSTMALRASSPIVPDVEGRAECAAQNTDCHDRVDGTAEAGSSSAVRRSRKQQLSCSPLGPSVLEPPPLNPEDALAERIISSIGSATPSPRKRPPHPSLAERTRSSLAQGIAREPVPEASLPDSLSLPELPELTAQVVRNPNPQSSLLERTRLSMAVTSHNSRQSKVVKEKRESGSRQSLFPVNQFDTPRGRKSFQALEEARSGDSTPKEVLFSDDIDYEHVFKSRPRVAHSPVFARPQAECDGLREAVDGLSISYDDEFDEGVTGVDLADVDADDEDGFTQTWENSPLRHAGGGSRAKSQLIAQMRQD
jgi:hypothetical protein